MANDELMRYWQMADKLNLLNQRIFPRAQLACARFIPISQIEKGWLDNGLGGERQTSYLAPFCFKTGAELSIPFWLEATVLPTGELQPKKPSALIWVLSAFLDSLSPQLPILSSVHVHDALLHDYFGSPTEGKVFETWTEYYTECLRFMTALHPNWKQEFVQTGFDLLDKGLVLPIAEMLTLKSNNKVNKTNITHITHKLVENYLTVDFIPTKRIEAIAAPILSKNLFFQEKASWCKQAFLGLAGMEWGDCLAIEHDQDAPLQTFFYEWSQYIFLERALQKKSLPIIAIIIPSMNIQNNIKYHNYWGCFPKYATQTLEKFREVFTAYFATEALLPKSDTLSAQQMALYAHKMLMLHYGQYKQGLRLTRAYRKNITQFQIQDNQLYELKKQDAILEKNYQNWLDAQAALSESMSTNVLGQIWQKLVQNKSKNLANNIDILSQYLVLDESDVNELSYIENIFTWAGEKLRKIQVERTKLYVELVKMNELISKRQGQLVQLLAWQKQHKLIIFSETVIQLSLAENKRFNIFNDQIISAMLNKHFSKIMRECANLYWQAQHYLGEKFICDILYQDPHDCFSYQPNQVKQPQVDYLFVLQANEFSPMLGRKFCAQADRMVGFSGRKIVSMPVLTPLQDTWLTSRHQLTQHHQDSVLEEMGMLASTGDAFQVIRAHNVYDDPIVYLKAPTHYPSANLLPAKIDFRPIIGKMVADRGSFMNSLEAQHILNWLKLDIQGGLACDQIMILTVFAAQKVYLQELLAESSLSIPISIPIYTLREAMGKRAKCVIVSMVHSAETIGPSIYDQNPQLLSNLLQIAQENVVIFADPGIFALSHTTLGKFSNKVLTRTPEQNKQNNDILSVLGL